MLSVLAPPINTYELLKTANFEVAPCNESYVDFLGYGQPFPGMKAIQFDFKKINLSLNPVCAE